MFKPKMQLDRMALTDYVNNDGTPSQSFQTAANQVIEQMVNDGLLADTTEDRAKIILAFRLTFAALAPVV